MVILDYKSIDGRLGQCQAASRDELLARISDGIDSVMAWAACCCGTADKEQGFSSFFSHRVLISGAHFFQLPANNLPHFLPSHAGALIRMLGRRAREMVACGDVGTTVGAPLAVLVDPLPSRRARWSAWLDVSAPFPNPRLE